MGRQRRMQYQVIPRRVVRGNVLGMISSLKRKVDSGQIARLGGCGREWDGGSLEVGADGIANQGIAAVHIIGKIDRDSEQGFFVQSHFYTSHDRPRGK